jgi:hypothetical protein
MLRRLCLALAVVVLAAPVATPLASAATPGKAKPVKNAKGGKGGGKGGGCRFMPCH